MSLNLSSLYESVSWGSDCPLPLILLQVNTLMSTPNTVSTTDNTNCVKAVSKKSINLLMLKAMRDTQVKWIKLSTQKPVD